MSNQFCNYCQKFTATDDDGDCDVCHLSKPPRPNWETDKVWLTNKLYGDIFPVLAGYETASNSAHATTQSLVTELVEKCGAWTNGSR